MNYKKYALRLGFVFIGAILLMFAGCSTGNNPDTTDPVIDSISHSPTPAYTGEEITFNVDAHDNRSDVTVKFDYNEDGIFETTNNKHTFNDPGSHKVGIQVSDQAGNTTAQNYFFDVLSPQGILTVQNNTQYLIRVSDSNGEIGTVNGNSTRAFTLPVGTYSITAETVDSSLGFNWGPMNINLTSDGETIAFN